MIIQGNPEKMNQRDCLLFFKCIIDLGAEVVRDFIDDKIQKKYQTKFCNDFLKDIKHHMYHQLAKKNQLCCECPNVGCSIRPSGNLNKTIFAKLFACIKPVRCLFGHTRRNGTSIVKCICEYTEKIISITELDLTDLNSLCMNSPLSTLLTPSEKTQLDVIIDLRNKVCHSVNSKIYTKPELNSMWTDCSDALSLLYPLHSKYIKMLVQSARHTVLDEEDIQRLLSNVQQVLMDNKMYTDHIKEQTKQLGEIRNSQNRQEKQNAQVLNKIGELSKDMQNVKAILSASISPGTSSASARSLLQEGYNKEIEVKIKLSGIDEDKMKNGLERDQSSEQNDGWKTLKVRQGCILLEMRALSDTFTSEHILYSRIETLVKRIVKAGEVDTSEKAEIDIGFNVKSHLTTEEETIIRNVFSKSSKYQSQFRKKSEEKMATTGQILLPQDKEDAREIKGIIKTRENLQILKKESGGIVECPKCLNKLKCEQCKSKNLIIHDLMSKKESDDLQIRHVMGELQGLIMNSTKYEFQDLPLIYDKKEEEDLHDKELTPDHQEQTVDLESITDDPCDICGGKEKEDGNELVYCGKCKVLVHQGCYYIPDLPDEEWFCRPCSEGVQPKCILCNQYKGAMAKTSDGKEWAHMQCVWWIPEIIFEDEIRMEKMESLEKIPKERWTMTCCLCKQQEGACIQCCVKGCYKAFHSRCGFDTNLLMEMIEEPKLVFKPHCPKHSSVASNKKTKRKNKKGGTRKRIINQEGSNIQSESQPKKRKLRDKKAQEIPLEEIQLKNEQGDICLHVAAQNSDRKQISSLLDRISKASLNCIDNQNKKGMTPLFISVLRNDADIVKMFLQHGANPNIFAQDTKEQFDAPIHIAASGGDQYLKTITALLADETILLNSFNSAGYTALHLAVNAHGDKISKGKNKNSVNIIEKLIVAGVDPNLQETKYGKTPLMCAIETLDIALVETFVKLIDPKKLQQVLKAESFEGKNVPSIIDESKHVFNEHDYKKLNNLLEDTRSDSSTSY